MNPALLAAETLRYGKRDSGKGEARELPAGEFQTTDPDGYCLMVTQSAADTP